MSRRFGGIIPRPSASLTSGGSSSPRLIRAPSSVRTTTTTETVTTRTKYASEVDDEPPSSKPAITGNTPSGKTMSSVKPLAKKSTPNGGQHAPTVNGTRPSKAGPVKNSGGSTFSSTRTSTVPSSNGTTKTRTVNTSISRPAPTRTVRTTITTLTTKPRVKAEKVSPPLFNVTNHTPASSIQKSGYRNATTAKTNGSSLPTRPSRTLNPSPSAKSSRDPPSTTSTLGSIASSTSFTYHSGSAIKTGTSKSTTGSTVLKPRPPLPNPILKKTSNSSIIKAPPPEERPIPPECVRCDICKRGFLPDRLEKHREACRKIENRPKKVFNATKMRTAGTEQEAYIRRGAHKKDVPVKKSNWRAKHDEFLRNVREAKKVQEHLAKGGKLSDLPPPPPSENPDYVQCPHCGRKFNEGAAERHIPKCANILSNKKKPSAASTATAKRR